MTSLLKDGHSERRLYVARMKVALFFMLMLLLALVGRLYALQITEHTKYTLLSQKNYIRLKPAPATRGLIYDRHMTLLAENLPSYRLDYTQELSDRSSDQVIAELSELMTLRASDIESFQAQLSRARVFDSVPIRYGLSDAEVSLFAVNKHRFSGVQLSAALKRHYPYADALAHVLGYVGRISAQELREHQDTPYLANEMIGKTGIESFYEPTLRGQLGYTEVESNAHGRMVRTAGKKPFHPGDDLILTLDMDLQSRVHELMQGKKGAAIALDPKTGDILAMVSAPAFDPNAFVMGIDEQTYAAYHDGSRRPLFNRVTQGQYPPASTIKPLVAVAGLDAHRIEAREEIFDPGYFKLNEDSRVYRDWKAQGHGWVNLTQAMGQSCDTYFYILSERLGVDLMAKMFRNFGLGAKTGIDLPIESRGLVPDTEWKRRVKGEGWFVGETLITGIGQGFMLATPLQLAQATAAIANRGDLFKPRLVRATRDASGQIHDVPIKRSKHIELSDVHWQEVIDAMASVVNGQLGTARRLARGTSYTIAGKTGTAQVYSLKEGEVYHKASVEKHLRDHSLFIAFAPVEDPKIVVTVILENESGSTDLSKAILDAYLTR